MRKYGWNEKPNKTNTLIIVTDHIQKDYMMIAGREIFFITLEWVKMAIKILISHKIVL